MCLRFCSIILLFLIVSCSGGDDSPSTPPDDQASLPSVSTTAVTSITENSAVAGGNVTDDGGANITARGVCWSTSQNPTINDSNTTNGSGTGEFTSQITGLTEDTQYYVRAYSTNSEGTAYGQQQSFTTLADETNCGTIFNGNISLGSQPEVDAFTANSYQEITGNLIIEEYVSGAPKITDLSGFSCLQSVGGILRIESTDELLNLEGLHNLQSVGGISILRNISLVSISQLSNINELDQGLIIIKNQNLNSLLGLQNLAYSSIVYLFETALTSVESLANLEVVDDYIELFNNDNLINLTGLEGLNDVNSLLISDNSTLNNLDALSSIENITEALSISGSPLVSTLMPFNNVNLNINSLNVSRMNGLESLNGINGISNLESIFIEDNEMLQDISLTQSLTGSCNFIRVSGNPLLETIDFGLIETVTQSILISGGFLNELNFNSITSIGQELTISAGDQLESITFPNLMSASRIDISGLNINEIDFNGITNLTDALYIEDNNALTSLDGIANITSIGEGGLYIENLSGLTNLDGLSNLLTLEGNISIFDNENLTDLCGLQPLFLNNGFTGSTYNVSLNAYNPSQQDIIDGNCSQ